MEDKQQWLSMAAIVVVVAGLGFFLYRQSRQTPEQPMVTNQDQEIEDKANQVIEQMQAQIPENAQRANLKDVSGGDGVGVATRVEEESSVEHSVLAALPELATGEFYEGYLARDGEGEEKEYLYLGRLTTAKGGWKLETNNDAAAKEYSQVVVSKETDADKTPEEIILEGSF